MKKSIILLCIPAIFMVNACSNSTTNNKKADIQTESTGDSTKKVAYACPMDCEKGKTYDQPGKCPVCEMDLEKK